MSNTLGNLNDHLFAQMVRLGNDELEGEQLDQEVKRAKAVIGVASQIISNGSLVLQAQKMADDYMNADLKMPEMLEG